MNRYKILHIITRFDKGGSAENTFLTLIGLNNEKFELTMITGGSKGFNVSKEIREANEKDLEKLRRLGIRVIPVNTLIRSINPIYDIAAFLKLFLIIKKGGYDIVHSHTSKAGLLGRWAAFFAGVPVIIHTPHGHVFKKYFGHILTFIFLWLERVTSIITDKIITLTKICRDDHIEFKVAPPEKFVTIHSGIEMSNFNITVDISLTKKSLDIPPDRLVIGAIGRLVHIKGHKYLLDAMKYVIEEISDVYLIFLGDGTLRKNLEEQSLRLGMHDKVRFLGWRNNVAEILSTFDLFVLPSLNEGMGKVLVEAMLAGKPIVAANTGGIPELIKNGENGLLVPVENSNELSAAIIKLLKDKELRSNMGSRGKEIGKLYSSDRMVEMIEELYRNALKTKGIIPK